MASRRDFLRGALAAAAAVPYGLHASDSWAAITAPRALVDWHSHYVSKAEFKYLSARTQPPRVVTGADGTTQLDNVTTVSAAGGLGAFSPSDIKARIENLQKNGIQRQLITQTVAMGFDATLSLEDQRRLFRAFNDELAEVVAKNKPHFLAVAALPSADPVWAAEELA